MKIVLVTGMSGAGRSTAARALEDQGYFVMDNIPPALIVKALDLLSDQVAKAAIVIDVRGGGSLPQSIDAINTLKSLKLDISILFLDAQTDELVHRFESSRRPHPLQTGAGLLEAINTERSLLGDLRSQADLIIDTTGLSPHDARRAIEAAFDASEEAKVVVTLTSFGFKHGTPIDADLVFDVRFLPNPHWNPVLKPLSGKDEPVNDFVMSQPISVKYLDQIQAVVETAISGYLEDSKRYLTVAIGCTGGRHRSVAMAENLASRLVKDHVETYLVHRDCDRD